jgi:hypothetical protein
MRHRIVVLVVIGIGVAAPRLRAKDAYVISVDAASGVRSDGTPQAWVTQTLFHNVGALPQSMRVVGASNGVVLPINDPLLISPGRTVLAEDLVGPFGAGVPLLVVHMEVGDSVAVASRLISGAALGAEVTTPPPSPSFGSIGLPVFYQLVPAGEEQVLPFVDLAGLMSRINLSLYNAGDTVAHALVEIVSACDDRVSATGTFSVPADTIEQVPIGEPPGCDPGQSADGPTYLRVTLDQPGFAVAATRASGLDATIPVGTAGPVSP